MKIRLAVTLVGLAIGFALQLSPNWTLTKTRPRTARWRVDSGHDRRRCGDGSSPPLRSFNCCGGTDRAVMEEPANPGKEPRKRNGLGHDHGLARAAALSFLEQMEFCPVCMLRKALAGGVIPDESSLERAVNLHGSWFLNDLSTMSW